MPTGDLARMPADRRRRLVRTAAAEFASAGYERASLNKIIKACGMSKSSFYHVFDAKQDLFDLVVADLSAELGATLDVPSPDAFEGPGFWSAAEALWRAMATTAADEALLALGRMFHLSNTPDGARGAVTATLEAVRTWLAAVLERGRTAGAVRADLPLELQTELVFSILQTFDAWTLQHGDLPPTTPSDATLSDLVDSQWEILRRVLAT